MILVPVVIFVVTLIHNVTANFALKTIPVETTTVFLSWLKFLPTIIKNPSGLWHVYVYMCSDPLWRSFY